MRTLLAAVAVSLVLGCEHASSEATSPRAFNVSIDAAALNDLPQSCFRGPGLVVTSPQSAPPATRWTLFAGASERIELSPTRVWLGDAGSIQLPERLERRENRYVAEVAHSADAASPWTRVELSLDDMGRGLRGTMRLSAAKADVNCDISLKVTGQPTPMRLVASR